MPTGSKDAGVLLDWLLDSMGLVRRSGGDESGALHRIVREALLSEPLRGWDSKDLGDVTGLSNTGIHHQMVKLRECGLVLHRLTANGIDTFSEGGQCPPQSLLLRLRP